MEYINDINITEAIVHILDTNVDEPVLNDKLLVLGEELYNYLFRHIQKSLKDEELKYGIFKGEDNQLKDIIHSYERKIKSFVYTSKDIANYLFKIVKKSTLSYPSDVAIVKFQTEYGEFIAVLKLDYVKNYMHSVDVVDDKIGIKIIEQYGGLPASSQKISKAAFIKINSSKGEYELLTLDKTPKSKKHEDDGYFTKAFLKCTEIENSRNKTRILVSGVEEWTRGNLKEDAEGAEFVRTAIKKVLRDNEEIDINKISDEIFADNEGHKESFNNFMKEQGLTKKFELDKEYVEKKLKRTRIKIDKDIDVYISEEAYHDPSRFTIKRNGDGTINMTIRNITNYMEK